MTGVVDLQVRRATDDDLPSVIALLTATLGWHDDARHEALFRWKHRENPYGTSPAWLAVDGDRLAGFRVLMPWAFECDGAVVRAVRAVDTATDPEYQGRGIFTRLTLAAVEELTARGIGFVFNTPNDKSRPGYLKMGWQEVGRLAVAARPIGPTGLARMVRARTPAELWSEPATDGFAAADVLADESAVARLLASRPAAPGLRTHHTPATLAWRYGTPLLNYRAVTGRNGVDDGIAIFRIRRRGEAREAALCEVVVPGDAHRARRDLVARVARTARADYVVALAGPDALRSRLAPLPGQGPVLTWRALRETSMPLLASWHLTLGDVELF